MSLLGHWVYVRTNTHQMYYGASDQLSWNAHPSNTHTHTHTRTFTDNTSGRRGGGAQVGEGAQVGGGSGVPQHVHLKMISVSHILWGKCCPNSFRLGPFASSLTTCPVRSAFCVRPDTVPACALRLLHADCVAASGRLCLVPSRYAQQWGMWLATGSSHQPGHCWMWWTPPPPELGLALHNTCLCGRDASWSFCICPTLSSPAPTRPVAQLD